MNDDFAAAMLRATQLTRAQNLMEATRVIQAALAAGGNGISIDGAAPQPEQRPTLRLTAPDGESRQSSPPRPFASASEGGVADLGAFRPLKARRPLGEVLRALRQGQFQIDDLGPLTGRKLRPTPLLPEGAKFLTRGFTCAAGTRRYKLYIPASASDRPLGLVVMLHGCKQDPDDFAAGTEMNAVAESRGLLVAYPEQTKSSNASSCWNWFNPNDQKRDLGEPSIVAGLTREIMSEFNLDRRRVFIAGLSAGGAMAAVMGETYPDLYEAVGVHSGLAHGSAHDVVSAFAAMRGETGAMHDARARTVSASGIRTIVFHGSADHIVNSSNAERVVAAASDGIEAKTIRSERGRSSDGRTFTREIVAGKDGEAKVEFWLIDGSGHAWSGGDAAGSFADRSGPSASKEMVRFFLEEPA